MYLHQIKFNLVRIDYFIFYYNQECHLVNTIDIN